MATEQSSTTAKLTAKSQKPLTRKTPISQKQDIHFDSANLDKPAQACCNINLFQPCHFAAMPTASHPTQTMQLLNLRERPDAIALIANWHFAEWHALFPERTLADFAAELTQCLSPELLPQSWLLVDENQQICGTASLLLQDMTTNQHLSPWLANIYIAPAARGRGLGQWLVQAVMAQAKTLGLQQLYLFTEDQSAFYQKLGWQHHHKEQYEGHWVYVMQHQL